MLVYVRPLNCITGAGGSTTGRPSKAKLIIPIMIHCGFTQPASVKHNGDMISTRCVENEFIFIKKTESDVMKCVMCSSFSSSETWRDGQEESAPVGDFRTRAAAPAEAARSAADSRGEGPYGQPGLPRGLWSLRVRQRSVAAPRSWNCILRIKFLILTLLFWDRGDWSGRGKHRVLPWRIGQRKHQWCEWSRRPQQPAELRQRRGLLYLQPKSGLLRLKHQPMSFSRAAASDALSFQSYILQLSSPAL